MFISVYVEGELSVHVSSTLLRLQLRDQPVKNGLWKKRGETLGPIVGSLEVVPFFNFSTGALWLFLQKKGKNRRKQTLQYTYILYHKFHDILLFYVVRYICHLYNRLPKFFQIRKTGVVIKKWNYFSKSDLYALRYYPLYTAKFF